jgi:hypothetical protein
MTANGEARVRLTVEDLRAEAEACRKSSMNNGEYNASFLVAAIVLESLAKQLEARVALENSHDE